MAASVIGGLRTGFWSYKTARTLGKQKSVSSARSTVRNVRQLDQLAEALDRPAERWQQSSCEKCSRFVVEKSQ